MNQDNRKRDREDVTLVIARETSASSPVTFRVVIADDSSTVRVALTEILERNVGFEIVGVARDGHEVVSLVHRLAPDLVIMGVNMPGLDGLAATRRIMAERPTPVVVFSGVSREENSAVTFDAIAAGAVDVMPTPDGAALHRDPALRRRLLAHLHDMASVKVVRRRIRTPMPYAGSATRARFIAIGASTGGPPVLREVLGSLGPASPPVMLVQHMSDGFVEGFVAWLDRQIPASVVVAQSGTLPRPGHVYVAPSEYHLEISRTGALRVHAAPAIGFHRPSCEPLFQSVAKYVGSNAVGVMLTGMGRDGVEGFSAMAERGCFTLAQEPSSCVVPAMPNAVIAANAARFVGSPVELRGVLGSVRHAP